MRGQNLQPAGTVVRNGRFFVKNMGIVSMPDTLIVIPVKLVLAKAGNGDPSETDRFPLSRE